METIEVRPDNLYVTGYIVDFPEDGESLLLRDKLELEPDITDKYYTVRGGDRLRRIAWNYYKDYDSSAANLWWVIADVNNIYNPADLTEWVGKDLWIPSYQKVKLKI